MIYKDVKFMTAIEKERVVKQFNNFVKHLIKDFGDDDKCFKAFTKGLYEHLHLHCGFIAHYDRHGFYHTYFGGQNIDDLNNFMNHFINEEGKVELHDWCAHDYDDINSEMAAILINNSKELIEKFGRQTEQDDRETIRLLMKKHSIKEIEVILK